MRSAVRQARNVFDIIAGHLAFFGPTVSVRSFEFRNIFWDWKIKIKMVEETITRSLPFLPNSRRLVVILPV